MNKIYLFLFSLLVLTACSKDGDMPRMDYPANFKYKQINNSSPVRMFTRNGEVKDQQLIRKFISNQNHGWYHPDGLSSEISDEGTFTLQSKSAATYVNGNVVRDYDMAYANGVFTFTSTVEGTLLYNSSGEYGRTLYIAICKYKPLMYDRQVLAPNTGYTYSYKTKAQKFAKLENDKLQFPFMIYTLKAYSGPGAYSTSTFAHDNAFDESGISVLNSNDTLVVQEFVQTAIRQ